MGIRANETAAQYQERMLGYRAEFESRHPSAAGRWTQSDGYQDSLHNYAYIGWLSLCEKEVEKGAPLCAWLTEAP